MPLPQSTLSLGPHTQTGESEHSKPKVAMLVRLSTETLDALQALGEKPPMEFEFGDTPGIHIGNTLFPMRPLREETPHELYLRTHSASKPNSSLKLYANVTGKFTIEHDKIGDNLKGRIREKTKDAAKQREDRRMKVIEPPPNPPIKKKRKENPTSSMFRSIRPSDQAKLNASAQPSPVPARVASPVPPQQKQRPADPTLRKRLIRCVATLERSRDQIVKLVAGADCDTSIRLDVLNTLDEIGEQTSATKKGEGVGSKTWRLRTESWTEVRPFEWPNLTEQERINLARTGRQKLSSLGIPSSDPLWEFFTYRASTSNNASAPSSSISTNINGASSNGDAQHSKKTEVKPKRGLTSKEVKDKKARPKLDQNGEIPMKDEGARTVSQASGEKVMEVNGVSRKAPIAGASRKLPGSGFKMNKPLKPDATETSEDSNRTSGKAIEQDANPPLSLNTKPAPPTPDSTTKSKVYGSTMPTQRIRKLKESDVGVATDSDREKGPDRLRETARSKVPIKPDERRTLDAPTLKRRQVDSLGDDSEALKLASAPNKKRKIDGGVAVTSSSTKDTKASDPVVLKKSEAPGVPLRQKLGKEPPPQPQPPPKTNKKETLSTRPSGRDGKRLPYETASSTQSQPRESKRNALEEKRRRASHIYTSSEDEGEIRKPRRDDASGTLPTPPMTLLSAQTSGQRSSTHEPKQLPSDHAGLRERYSSTYNEYMTVFVKMVKQKTKIDSLLRNGDSGSTTDSEGDAELLDTEDLTKLSIDYKRLHGELATIRAMFFEPD